MKLGKVWNHCLSALHVYIHLVTSPNFTQILIPESGAGADDHQRPVRGVLRGLLLHLRAGHVALDVGGSGRPRASAGWRPAGPPGVAQVRGLEQELGLGNGTKMKSRLTRVKV